MSDEAAVVEETVDSTPDTSTESAASVPSTPETAPAAAAAPAPQQSVWDAFKNLDEFQGQDDLAIARRLYASMEREKAATQALQQYQQYIPYAQQYLQNREPFERWLASQREQPAPQQPVQKTTAAEAVRRWWNPPEVRESYKQYLVRDENGREVISADAPLDAKHSLYEYQKYKADFAQKFLTNPEEALGPMIQEIAQQQAAQIVQSQFAEMQQHQYVSGLEKENADWLYEADGKTPTKEGLAAQQYIEQAAQLGIQSPEARWEYATKMIERDLLDSLRGMQSQNAQRSAFEAGLPQQTAPAAVAPAAPAPAADAATQAQKDIEFLRREASRNPSRAAGSSDPRTPQAPLTFEQRLARQLARDGIN
jgi:hypothetical protein